MVIRTFRTLMNFALSTTVFLAGPVSEGAPSRASSRGAIGTTVLPASAPPVLAPPAVAPSPAMGAIAGALTYQAWKELRVEEARLVLERMMMETQIQQMQLTQNSADRSPGERQAVIRQQVAPARQAALAKQTVLGAKNGRVDQRLEIKADNKVEQARINLEIAQELTISDYLQIYLSQFRSSDALREVARRMNPEEVAELLMAYQQKAPGAGHLADTALAASRLCSGAALASPSNR